MAATLEGLRPTSMEFTARPALRTTSRASTRQSYSRGSSANDQVTANPSLSIIEVEAKLREKVRTKYQTLIQAFQNYDTDQTLSVTKGEFHRVLEAFCFPLTKEQFEGVVHKVKLNPNGTVKYEDFLNKFSGRSAGPEQYKRPELNNAMHGQGQGGQEANTDMVETMLRNKIKDQLKTVIKALQLYDYNSDGHIQRHELRKVLENYCFKMTDRQFDKLYQRYDFHHRGLINYKDFLLRLGVNVENHLNPKPANALQWQTNQPPVAEKRQSFRKPDEAQLAGMNFDQIELEFRKKMRANFTHIKKIFLAFDPNLDGFIALSDLKNILNQFTIPLTDQLFSQLMDRCGVKATGKISWEYFLDKFQDPQSHGNGQTIPIKPAHKYHPNMGTGETTNIRDIVKLLDNHVKSAYGSFKNAFLQLDKNRSGKLTRKDIRDVVNKFKFQLTDGQFTELMNLVDPQHTNSISYQRFLELFEPKEDMKEGHKWLKSVHRFNETQKPAILAWETVEDIMRDKIQAQWVDVSKAIIQKDPGYTGRISPKSLRNILEKFCIPMSDEHFETLMQTISEDDDSGQSDGKVSYMRLMHILGVSIKPGDFEGLSTQILASNIENEQIRHSQHQMKENEITQNMHARTKGMSVDEIIIRLKDKIHQHQNEFRNAFKKYDIRRKGKISKKDFRQVLEDMGIYANDEQFKELCASLNFTNGHMTYMNFVENFNDLRIGGPATELFKANNHRVNAIRGDEYGMSAIEVESKLRNKLRENFEDLRGAFYKFDDRHKGTLNKASFRRMLDTFMCFMNDEEFDKLCQRLGLEYNTRLSYPQFLEKFEVKDTEEGHKWLNSVHRYNETKQTPLLTAEQCHAELAQKAHRQFKDIAQMFRTMDNNGKGVIKKSDLREILYKFMLPISKEEFGKLWTMYDPAGSGRLTHAEFVRQLTGEEFTPGDQGGTSHNIIKQSYQGLEKHHRDQQAKHEQITLNQANTATVMSVETVLQQLKDRIRDSHKDYQSAFRKYDKRGRGYLTVADIQRLLVDLNYFLDDDQFYDLLQRLNLTPQNTKLYYEDFVSVFEEGRKESYDPKQQDANFAHAGQRTSKLSPDKAAEKMMKMVGQQLFIVQAALQAFDPGYTGCIRTSELRRVLDNFCFVMTEPQFKHFIGTVPRNPDNTVNYIEFLEVFGEKDPEAKRWLETISQNIQDGPRNMTMSQIQDLLTEKVSANYQAFVSSFTDVDYARIGVISKDDFREVLNKNFVRLSEEQFEALWNIMKINEFGNLEYHEFLRRYTIEKKPATPLITGRPGTGMSQMSFRSRTSMSRASSTGSGRPFTPLVNAQGAEKAIHPQIQRNWKEIQRMCRDYDPNSTGAISQSQFKSILSSLNIEICDDDVRSLLMKYDLKNNYTFCYSDFLRHLVLPAPRREKTFAGTDKKNSSSDNTNTRISQCVQNSWKDMRRDFRHLDPSGSGLVTEEDFRDVLRNNKLDATEGEFFDLTMKYDKKKEGMIAYNDFIKDHIN